VARVAALREAMKQRRMAPDDPSDPPTFDHVRRVAVFGAGEHGQAAVELANRCGWEVPFFLDNAADSLRQVAGRPVIHPAALDPGEVDLVIVASVAWRDEMLAEAARRGYRPGVEAIWFLDPVVVGGIRMSVDYAPM
jgi:UDP-N-acetylmuramoylalanine-D-glutamate ligase